MSCLLDVEPKVKGGAEKDSELQVRVTGNGETVSCDTEHGKKGSVEPTRGLWDA